MDDRDKQWLDRWCSTETRDQLDRLAADGEARLSVCARWAVEVQVALSALERQLASQELTDELHHEITVATGAQHLLDVAEAFTAIVDMAAAPARRAS